MFRILIVDDEKIEREGIRFLISKYEFELDEVEAENGSEALEILDKSKFDILITDIKMPFMDGLQLAHRARIINPDIVTVIFSAYGEFDFARKAIDSKVQHYILKPIDPDEFRDVMTDALAKCQDIRDRIERDVRTRDVYKIGLEYGRSGLLFDLLNGGSINDEVKEFFRELGLEIDGRDIRLAFIDSKERFFDEQGKELERLLPEIAGGKFEFLDLNEYQGVIFLFDESAQGTESQLMELGQRVISFMHQLKQTIVSVMFGKLILSADMIYEEYRRIEDLSETNFYNEISRVVFADEITRESEVLTEIVDKLVDDIKGALSNHDFRFASDALHRLFGALAQDASFSPIYVKYICGDILHAYTIAGDRSNKGVFIKGLEDIFAEHSLVRIREQMLSLLEAKAAAGVLDDNTGVRKAIEQVIRIIENEYSTDLSLEYIARKVYLTPTYLSYLFKQETGHTLLKYLTSYRMSIACRLLRETNKKVADICSEVGYANLSYFCSIFKSHFKTTPAKFREAGS